MSATSPAVESLLRILRTVVRLPWLAWHLLVHLPIMLLVIALTGAVARAVRALVQDEGSGHCITTTIFTDRTEGQYCLASASCVR